MDWSFEKYSILMFGNCISVNSITGKLKPSAKQSHPVLVVGEPSLHPDPQRVPPSDVASVLESYYYKSMGKGAVLPCIRIKNTAS